MPIKTRQKPVLFTAKNFRIAMKQAVSAFMSGTPAQLAAGVAYYGTLAFFPLVAALLAIASMTLDAQQVTAIASGLAGYLPKDIAALLSTQLQNAAAHQHANFAVMIFALALSIFGASGAMDSIMKAITTIYGVKDTRSIFAQKGISLLLTTGFIITMAVTLPLLFVGQGFLKKWGISAGAIHTLSILRWLLLLFMALIGLGVIYHFSLPNRRKWWWISWGSIISTVLWLLITAVLFIYLQYFSNFSDSYSLFAGIIALMMWLNFSAFAVLMGADVNKIFDQDRLKSDK